MAAKNKNPVQYIFCAYIPEENDWYASQILRTKEGALEGFEMHWAIHMHGFFLAVTLPEIPEMRNSCEDYPTFTV